MEILATGVASLTAITASGAAGAYYGKSVRNGSSPDHLGAMEWLRPAARYAVESGFIKCFRRGNWHFLGVPGADFLGDEVVLEPRAAAGDIADSIVQNDRPPPPLGKGHFLGDPYFLGCGGKVEMVYKSTLKGDSVVIPADQVPAFLVDNDIMMMTGPELCKVLKSSCGSDLSLIECTHVEDAKVSSKWNVQPGDVVLKMHMDTDFAVYVEDAEAYEAQLKTHIVHALNIDARQVPAVLKSIRIAEVKEGSIHAIVIVSLGLLAIAGLVAASIAHAYDIKDASPPRRIRLTARSAAPSQPMQQHNASSPPAERPTLAQSSQNRISSSVSAAAESVMAPARNEEPHLDALERISFQMAISESLEDAAPENPPPQADAEHNVPPSAVPRSSISRIGGTRPVSVAAVTTLANRAAQSTSEDTRDGRSTAQDSGDSGIPPTPVESLMDGHVPTFQRGPRRPLETVSFHCDDTGDWEVVGRFAPDAANRCYLKDTLFQTSSKSYSKAEGLKVHDVVLSANGSKIEVAHAQMHKKADCILVTLRTNQAELTVTDNHRIIVPRSGGYTDEVCAGQLKKDDQVYVGLKIQKLTKIMKHPMKIDLVEIRFNPDHPVETRMAPRWGILTKGAEFPLIIRNSFLAAPVDTQKSRKRAASV